jgi:putative ABC transport system permease protein
MTGWIQDFRYAVRQLRKSPGFTSVAVVTLALGIGATAAMFSVIDAVVLRPLPYNNMNRIVDMQTISAAGSRAPISWPAYLDMRKLSTSFEALAGYEDYWGMTLSSGKQTQYLNVTQGSDNFFDAFGVRPLLGRTFLPGEDQPGKNDVAVLGYDVWRQTFNADTDVVNKVVRLDGRPYVVIGVMPEGFRFPFRKPNLIYIPMHVRPHWDTDWGTNWLLTVGRLKPEATPQQAQAEIMHVMEEIGQQHPATNKDWSAQLIPIATTLHATRTGGSELSEVGVMLGAVFAVLLIACANVAGLLLARSVSREREMSLRVAVGAARRRLIRQLLVESALLGLLGGGTGLLLASSLLSAVKVFLAHAFMRGANIQLNLSVIATTLAAGVLSSVAAGLIPAWRTSRTSPSQSLTSGVKVGPSRRQRDVRAGFVVVQISLSFVLVVFSGLLLFTLQRMLQTNLGFSTQNLLTLGINIPSGDYKGNFVTSFMEPLEQHAQSIAGVTAAGFIDQMPVVGYGSSWTPHIVGLPRDPPDRERLSETRSVTSGYFEAMGLRIVRGRNFTPQDTPSSQPVAIVNEAFVKEFLTAGQDPLAQAFEQGPRRPKVAIVGVAHDVRQNLFDQGMPEIDFPFSQLSQEAQQNVGSLSVALLVRTTVSPASTVPQLRKALFDIAPTVAFQTPETMDEVLEDALITNRMQSWLFGIFAGIALLLAVIGIYGLLTQDVTSRIRDIGVRMALGATRLAIAQTLIKRVSLLIGMGLSCGVLGTILLSRLITSVLVIQFEKDGIVIAALVVLVAMVGLVAALIPARRAAKVDPMVALRYE